MQKKNEPDPQMFMPFMEQQNEYSSTRRETKKQHAVSLPCKKLIIKFFFANGARQPEDAI
jgi:hypothetical protein